MSRGFIPPCSKYSLDKNRPIPLNARSKKIVAKNIWIKLERKKMLNTSSGFLEKNTSFVRTITSLFGK